ncbi:CNF1 family cytotoxic necrotizing factor [Escherichia coli]|nr:CNF1 family cytotoxic necrotizing factor [Escherichia coli]
MNTQWQQKYLLEYNELVSKFPSPEKVTSDYIKNRFKTDLPWFSWIDPDNTYFIQFSQNRSNSRAYTGWDHLGKYKTDVLTLTQAAIINIGYRFDVFDEANAIAGIYTTNNADLFNETNEAKMLPSEYLYFLKDCDFAGLYNKALSDYWSENHEKFKLLLKNYYVSSSLYLYKNKLISKDEYEFTMKALNREDNIALFSLDIYGYYSSDIFGAKNDDRVMLFVPGATNPFLFAENISLLRTRLKELITEKNNIELLSQHFSLYDRQDGTTFYGVDSVLQKIVNGSFDESYFLFSHKNLSERDVFSAIALSVQKRSFSDGDTIIKSNSEAQRDYALTIIQTIVSMAPIFDIILPEVSVPLSLGIIASSMGISFDQLINGDTYEERRSAIPGVATNAVLLGISFALPYLISKASENKVILSQTISTEDNILNETNIDKFLAQNGVNKDDIPASGLLEVEIKNSGIPVNLVRISGEDNQIVAVRGNTQSGIYYEVDSETGYEILSRRVYRTEYNNEIFWTRSGGLKGGQPFNFENLEIPTFFLDKPYSELASSQELSFINDDSPLLFPDVDSRLPKPTPEMEIRHYSSHFSRFAENTVTLMRGTTEEEAWNIASYKTAGGSNKELEEIFIGGGPQANLSFTEYTSNIRSADAASRRHFLVVINVKMKYISNDNVLYANYWAIPDEAPVEVLAVVDRRFIFPEPPSPPKLSLIQRLSRRFFTEDIAETSRINYRRLNSGNINVLKGRGSLSSKNQRSIYLNFYAVNADDLRPDEIYVKKNLFDERGYDRYFYNNAVGLDGSPTLNTYTGELLTDPSSFSSTYWSKYNLTNKTSIIRVVNSARGANGIRIALEEVQENKPVIITNGDLSGCTTIVARKGGDLYAVHTGTLEPLIGFTSTTGVKKAVEVLSTLAGQEIPALMGTINNDFLVDFLADNFDKSLITYSSSKLKPNSIITVSRDNVSTFPYYTDDIIQPGFGTSVTILVRKDNNTVVRSLSESYSASADGSKISVFKILSKDF